VVWNTRYFEQARVKLEQKGHPVPDSVWQHLSPILWEHIHLVGSYHFTEFQVEGEFRPLQEFNEPLTRDALRSQVERELQEEEMLTIDEELPIQQELSVLQLTLLPEEKEA
jgi:hypothetical protein